MSRILFRFTSARGMQLRPRGSALHPVLSVVKRLLRQQEPFPSAPDRARWFSGHVTLCTALRISESLWKESEFHSLPPSDSWVELWSFGPAHRRQSWWPWAAKVMRVERLGVVTKESVLRNAKWLCYSGHFDESDAYESTRVKFFFTRYLQYFLGKMKHSHFLLFLLVFQLCSAMQGLFLPSLFLNFRSILF